MDLLTELESLAQKCETTSSSGVSPLDITSWQTLFDFNASKAEEEITDHRANLNRIAISAEHWATQKTYPVPYFFYGTLADEDRLVALLGLEERPQLTPAKVRRARVEMRGKYRGVGGWERGDEVKGWMFVVGCEGHEDALRGYETDAYEVVRYFHDDDVAAEQQEMMGRIAEMKAQGSGASLVFTRTNLGRRNFQAKNISYVPKIDLESPDAGRDLVQFLEAHGIEHLDIVIVTAGYFAIESLKEPSYSAQKRMYRTCVIGPTILVTTLANKDEKLLGSTSKVILVSSESGSITLRHKSEGGGNYGHHASKTALNMSAKLLSLDLKDRGVAICTVHPGFMRTEMTRNVGFDKYWDEGGAVTPDVAAKTLIEWIETFDMSKTGQYWAPRGAGDIGTAEPVLGPKDKLPTPLQLPW
ncbi:oxidoreductase domain containing protein [Pyrenophora tritici-repentis Pt-1C-BFP]|uniref:Oxidoreductase domain containing protein n=1 Tax=Pyrenophora tritici-repentis (strain Pt-1C-BFP) TaxID=426418 RepID=B2WKE0_PYRTR|nr:oxidoreductase domain containing protein [Pyrenophora tritici-repentis Pt-1C-BFP]EDU43500.1 oxidoreductase domain containing protein [Pyrenophora tritici-repentis Pt-1C-BFP]